MMSNKLSAYCIFLCLVAVIMTSCAEREKKAGAGFDEQAIREARKLHNKSILEHDTVNIDNVWMDNFLLISSRDYQIQGKSENRRLFIAEFNTKTDVVYERLPDSIAVMEAWGMASEYGHWRGSWKEGANLLELKGNYYAKWHKVNGTWLLRTEVYTPTYCSGGSYCDNQPKNN